MPRTIGDLARHTGCKVQTVRYYEQLGLMPEPARSPGNQRLYCKPHADRLAFIRHARELGFALPSIRELLELSDKPHEPCRSADEIARVHLREVEGKIARLSALRAELQRMIRRCRQGHIAQCRVIEVLADHTHSHCLSADHDGPADDDLRNKNLAGRSVGGANGSGRHTLGARSRVR
jgi:DNA-binding transcriptional MerR regulator